MKRRTLGLAVVAVLLGTATHHPKEVAMSKKQPKQPVPAPSPRPFEDPH